MEAAARLAVVGVITALVVALSGARRDYFTAATCLCLLPTLPAIFLFATYRRPLFRVGMAALLILLLNITNNTDTKLSLEGLESLYDDGRMLDLTVHPSPEISRDSPGVVLEEAELELREGNPRAAIAGLTRQIEMPEPGESACAGPSARDVPEGPCPRKAPGEARPGDQALTCSKPPARIWTRSSNGPARGSIRRGRGPNPRPRMFSRSWSLGRTWNAAC